MVGQKIDEFEFQSELGKGGMGVVYLAQDHNLDRKVAIKMIDVRLSHNDVFLRRFRSEAKALAQLNHPNIVAVYAFRETEPGLMMIMEHVDGPSVREMLEQGVPMQWQHALPIMDKLLLALSEAHRRKIIHRDVKPGNILISSTNLVKVADFGLAKMQKPGDESISLASGGTLFYMAPEQVDGRANAIDHRTDIYASGMTLYKMLSGRTPFEETWSDYSIQKAIIEQDFPSPRHYNPEVPATIAEIITSAVAKNAADRFQSALEMREALNEAARSLNPASGGNLPARGAARVSADDRRQAENENAKSGLPAKRSVPFIVLLVLSLLLIAVIAWQIWPQNTAVEIDSVGQNQLGEARAELLSHSELIQQLVSISQVDLLMEALRQHESSITLGIGKYGELLPLDKCYVLLLDQSRIRGFWRYNGGVLYDVKTGQASEASEQIIENPSAIWIQELTR